MLALLLNPLFTYNVVLLESLCIHVDHQSSFYRCSNFDLDSEPCLYLRVVILPMTSVLLVPDLVSLAGGTLFHDFRDRARSSAH